MSAEGLVIIALMLPVGGAVLIAASHRAPNLREAASIATALALVTAVASLLPAVLDGGEPTIRWFAIFPGLAVEFRVEPLGLLFAIVASALWLVSSVYSIGYMRANDESRQTRFYVCFALALASTIGVAFAGNLLTLLIFYEALTLVTYPLVTHHGDQEAKRGGRTYLGILLLTSTVFLLPAIVATWMVAGTLDFTPGGILGDRLSAGAATALLALYVFGIGKAALMPFHRWLPAAMVAPAPVSALLHAVAVVKAGVFTIVKVIVYVFGIGASTADFSWLPYVAGFTVLAASVVALRADNLKRRLAYSTISQLSYVVLATAILAPISIVGAALHIVAHAFGKITLFFAAGAIYTAAHKTEVSQLDGIGRRMPWTLTAFAIGALSMIGLPPTGGMVSKWYMVSGAFQAEHWFALAVIVASTLLNAGYFVPIVYRAFLREPAAEATAHGEAPWTMVVALIATSALTVLLFFCADVPLVLARMLAGIAR
ncbi:MAG: monovalent cation/H+ antiporter subunit D family protein [Betaproteobacteria bacterium]|nr:monovalent cation/H+ antiporter subunit D family protein [Betaproteobacteria bacterium]